MQWRDETESWIHLKYLKESHPVEVAAFVIAIGISDEPAFAWWLPYIIRKQDTILSAIKSRICKTTHKYGIAIPTSTKHAHQINDRNGNTFWCDAIIKEMANVGIAFEVFVEG